MPKIIILRGNSGSGKTTAGRALQRKFGMGTMLISQDVVRREMIFVRDRPGNKAIDLLKTLVMFAYENCEVAILEGILYAEQYQILFDFALELYGENIFAYYFDLTFEETLKRHLSKANANEFGETEMRRWWHDRDYLPYIKEKMLGADMSTEDVVERICADIALI